jgi:ankyrin repeat protein
MRKMLRLLIDRHATVNLVDDQHNTALMAAVRAGSLPAVNLLLAAGADVNAADKDGRSAVAWAVRSSRQEMVKTLWAKGAKETPRKPRSLRRACRSPSNGVFFRVQNAIRRDARRGRSKKEEIGRRALGRIGPARA